MKAGVKTAKQERSTEMIGGEYSITTSTGGHYDVLLQVIARCGHVECSEGAVQFEVVKLVRQKSRRVARW